jgi:acyl-coenzyme A synthetase/AMP-(fatty) acid ligase
VKDLAVEILEFEQRAMKLVAKAIKPFEIERFKVGENNRDVKSILVLNCDALLIVKLLLCSFTEGVSLCIRNDTSNTKEILELIDKYNFDVLIAPEEGIDEKRIFCEIGGDQYNTLVLKDNEYCRHVAKIRRNEAKVSGNLFATDSIVLFTSGSSGKRKGVIIKNTAIDACSEMMNGCIGNTDCDGELIIGQIDHAFVIGRILSCAKRSTKIFLIDTRKKLEPKIVNNILISKKITGVACMPSLLYSLLKIKTIKNQMQATIRYAQIGAMYLSEQKKKSLVDNLPHTSIYTHYGMTEYMRATFYKLDANYEKFYSEGKPSMGTKIRINGSCSAISGQNNSDIFYGEIELCGPHIADGYLDPKEWEKRITPDGYLKTNDLGYLDKDGYLVHMGRIDGICNIHGKLMSIVEIENDLIQKDPALEGNIAIISYRFANDIGDTSLNIFVEKEAANRCYEACKQSNTLRMVKPKIWEVDMLPRMVSGKLDYNKMKDLLAEKNSII